MDFGTGLSIGPLTLVFQRLVRLGSFPAYWKQANATPIGKGPPSSLFPITDRFSYHQYCLRCLCIWCRFVADDLWKTVVRFQPASLPSRNATCDALLCVPHTLLHFRVGRRLELCGLISAQPLIGSAIREFSISSLLWVLEVLYCLYWHSCFQIDHSSV